MTKVDAITISRVIKIMAKEAQYISIKRGKVSMHHIHVQDVLPGIIEEVTEANHAIINNMRCHTPPMEIIDNNYDNSDEVFKSFYEKNVKDTFEDELSDIILYVMSLSSSMGIDIGSCMANKLKYNQVRSD